MRTVFTRLIATLILFVSLASYASVTVTVNSTSHTIPQTNEKGWGTNLTAWIQAISQYTLQPSGGSFSLTTQDVNFGSSYGLIGPYYKSRASALSSSGIFRMGNAEYIGWRNAADSGNLLLGVNSSNQLTYNGVVLASSSGPLFQDSLFTIYDNSDTTKLLQFQLSGITTGTTRTLTVPDVSDTIVTLGATQTLTSKTLTSPTMTAPTVSSGVLTIQSGSAGSPSLTIASDTDTGLYSSAANKVELVGGGYAGLQVSKSTGSYANVGMGGNASSSDNYPLLLQRSNASSGTYVQISNPDTSASSKATYQLSTDNGLNAGEVSVFTAATTTDAYAGRMTVRASDSTSGLSLIAGDGASNNVRIYTGGTYTSSGRALEIGSEKTITLPQTVATGSVSTPSTGLTLHNSSGVLMSKNSSGTARQYTTLDGTETLTNKTVTAPIMTYQVDAVSANTTLDTTYEYVTVDDSGGTKTITLPTCSGGVLGTVYHIKKLSASNSTVVSRAGSDTIDGATSYTLSVRYQAITIVCTATNVWSIY